MEGKAPNVDRGLFAEGAVVQLKGGQGPLMVVEGFDLDSQRLVVVWHDNQGHLTKAGFKASMVELTESRTQPRRGK